MADGHGRDRWARTSLIAAILANANRDPKRQRAYKPADFDPFASRRDRHADAIELTADNLGLLRDAFSRRQQGAQP